MAVMVLMALLFVGCSNGETENPTTNDNDEFNAGDNTSSYNDSDESNIESFQMIFSGVNVAPGQSFDSDAIDGEPTVARMFKSAFPDDITYTYNYDDLLEIHVLSMNNEDTILFVHILCETIETSEGISLGDSVSEVIAAYGEEFEDDGFRMSFIQGEVELSFLIRDEAVASIELWLVGLSGQ